MLKKPSILLSCTTLQQCCSPHQHQVNTSPSTLPPPRARPSKKPAHSRTYADVHPAPRPPFHEYWPDCKPPTIPTPYEIFQQQRGSPYSKRRFYELVKIYHPDRNGHIDSYCGGVSHTIKLERYRLIIAANDILSDPVKRTAYDRYGVGWNGHPEAASSHNPRPYYDPGEAKWNRNSDESPFNNATWEDWERWYHRHDKEKPSQFNMSQSAFLSFVALIATLGGVAQATRMGTYSSAIDQRIQSVTMECSDLLNSRTGFGNDREGRVQHFLTTRDPSGNGLKDEEEKTYKTLLKPREVVEQRDTKVRAKEDTPKH